MPTYPEDSTLAPNSELKDDRPHSSPARPRSSHAAEPQQQRYRCGRDRHGGHVAREFDDPAHTSEQPDPARPTQDCVARQVDQHRQRDVAVSDETPDPLVWRARQHVPDSICGLHGCEAQQQIPCAVEMQPRGSRGQVSHSNIAANGVEIFGVRVKTPQNNRGRPRRLMTPGVCRRSSLGAYTTRD